MKALSIRNLYKTYSNNVQALKDVSFDVKENDFFALLGPNGAGKTTIIGIITSLVKKDSGKISIYEYNLDTQINEAKACIGVVPQEFNFNIFESVINIVISQAGYYGIRRKIAIEKAEHYLNQLGLWDKRNLQAMKLSGGMKRRLMIARALIHEPKLLFLDEPTAGVDIELRRAMWDFLINMNKKNTTIILTTHYLEEAENLCKNLAIIDQGKIIKNTSMKSLLKKIDSQTIVIDLKRKLKKLPDIKGYKLFRVDSNIIEVQINRKQNLNDFFNKLNKLNIDVLNIRNKTNRLEELFVHLVEGNKR
jgi:ABC-2 type transport system ATP-binding protein